MPGRDALRGIAVVLRSGLPWEMLPRDVFGCSGMTRWRRRRDWQNAGVRDRLRRVLLERLDRAGELDWSRAALDAASIGARRGRRGRPPAGGLGPVATTGSPDGSRARGRPGRHFVTDR